MHIMKTQSINHGTIGYQIDRKRTLDAFAEMNTTKSKVLSMRKATFNEMQAEVDRLVEYVRMNKISLQDAPMHGGYHNKLNISVSETKIINLNAAIAGLAEDALLEVGI